MGKPGFPIPLRGGGVGEPGSPTPLLRGTMFTLGERRTLRGNILIEPLARNPTPETVVYAIILM